MFTQEELLKIRELISNRVNMNDKIYKYGLTPTEKSEVVIKVSKSLIKWLYDKVTEDPDIDPESLCEDFPSWIRYEIIHALPDHK